MTSHQDDDDDDDDDEFVYSIYNLTRGVARNLIWVGINGSRRPNNHIKTFKVD